MHWIYEHFRTSTFVNINADWETGSSVLNTTRYI